MKNLTPPDAEIAQKAVLQPISQIAEKLKLGPDDLETYGKYKAKISAPVISEEKIKKSRLILVTAVTPTPAGEGKTTVVVGLTDGLNKIGKKAVAALREPSLGPVFGIKGGAAGGGYSQVVPMEDINLHFTGDFAAIERAHNLLAAIIDNTIFAAAKTGSELDPSSVLWKRVIDMNDRSLRKTITGLGGKSGGILRESGFDITAASEVMAILCLSENLLDLKKRLGNIYIGKTYAGRPVYARETGAVGAMTALLRDALKPNLVQTLEGNPAFIHGGPFANIAQGTNSVIATKTALSLADYAVTEAGFGADLGAEKFFDIKCRSSGLKPAAVVLTATVRALKYHGGQAKDRLAEENPEAVRAGGENLRKHIQNLRLFGLPTVCGLNRFASDSEAEIAEVRRICEEENIEFAICEGHAKGGEGMRELAEKTVRAAESGADFRLLYPNEASPEEKITTVATKIYGAGSVFFYPKAKADLARAKKLGLEHLPVCIAKTQNSLSDNTKLLGRPEGFELSVREVEIAAGAGFLIPITGDILRMPGLPAIPSALQTDVDEHGNITGLF